MTGIILTVSKLLLVTDICLYYDQNKKELKYTLARILALTVGLLVFDVTDVMPIAWVHVSKKIIDVTSS